MSAQWSISGFIFWESNLVTDYNGSKMEIVHGEALPNTVMFSVVWWLFLAGDKDSWRNLCPQALVLQLTSPSVSSTLFLRLQCNPEQQSHQAENKNQAWIGLFSKSQVVILLTTMPWPPGCALALQRKRQTAMLISEGTATDGEQDGHFSACLSSMVYTALWCSHC